MNTDLNYFLYTSLANNYIFSLVSWQTYFWLLFHNILVFSVLRQRCRKVDWFCHCFSDFLTGLSIRCNGEKKSIGFWVYVLLSLKSRCGYISISLFFAKKSYHFVVEAAFLNFKILGDLFNLLSAFDHWLDKLTQKVSKWKTTALFCFILALNQLTWNEKNALKFFFSKSFYFKSLC